MRTFLYHANKAVSENHIEGHTEINIYTKINNKGIPEVNKLFKTYERLNQLINA